LQSVNPAKIKKAMGFDFDDVEACIITHDHQDHCKYADKINKIGGLIMLGPKIFTMLCQNLPRK
jgi:metal-dependent hydrolase (beta-lactamase superfamily II)